MPTSTNLDCRPSRAFTLIGMSRRIEAAQEPPGRHLGSARALELRDRAHALIPGGSHTYAKGDDQFPEARAWPHCARLGLPHLGHRRQRVHRVRHGASGGHARPRLSGCRRGCAPPDAARDELHPARADRARGGRGLARPPPAAEMVKFCKDGSDANDRRDHAGPRPHRARPRRPLRRPPILRLQRLVHRLDCDARRHSAGDPGPDRHLPLQRSRCSRCPVRGSRGRDRLCRARGGAQRPAGAGVPRGPARAVHAARRAVGARRDDHRIPLAYRRRTGDLRHRARSCDLRQGDGERLRVLRTRRQAAR